MQNCTVRSNHKDVSVVQNHKTMLFYNPKGNCLLPILFVNQILKQPTGKKKLVLGTKDIFDTEFIFSRFMVLVSSRELDKEKIFHHKLSPVPTSMFDNNCLLYTSRCV